MDVLTLLALFRLIREPDHFPISPSVATIASRLPQDRAVYDAIAEEAFRAFVVGRSEPDDASYMRVESIFRALLYLDGRSDLACLRLALVAFENKCGEYGVNSLAALANYFRTNGEASLPATALISAFETMTDDPDLSHNALECIRALNLRSR